MIQLLLSTLTHAVALLVYPGLLLMVVFGSLVELGWMRVCTGAWERPELLRRRPGPLLATVAICAVVAAVQTSAPLNPVPGDERNVVLAAVALAFVPWAQLALSVEFVAEPGLILVVQVCWLLAVLGPAVQPESLRPQVLGNVLVPGLLPVKIACAFLYLLCLPALMRLWPFSHSSDKRVRERLDGGRVLSWFPYCGLFTTLFLPPANNDLAGAARFLAITIAVAGVVVGLALLLRRRGAAPARGLYTRAITPYAVLVLALVVATSILMR